MILSQEHIIKHVRYECVQVNSLAGCFQVGQHGCFRQQPPSPETKNSPKEFFGSGKGRNVNLSRASLRKNFLYDIK